MPVHVDQTGQDVARSVALYWRGLDFGFRLSLEAKIGAMPAGTIGAA